MPSHAVSSLSVSVFLVLVSLCFTLSLRDNQDILDVTRARIAMLVVMGLGLIFMVFFLIIFLSHRSTLILPETDPEHIRSSYLRKLALMGIIIFFVLGSILDIANFASELACQKAWTVCTNSDIDVVHRIDIAFHIFRLVFMACETTLLWICYGLRFRGHALVIIGLVFVQAANIVLWFDSMVLETRNKADHNEAEQCFSDQTNTTDNLTLVVPKLPAFAIDCFFRNTTEYWIVETFSPALYPISIEFSLLSGECLAAWFYWCIREDDDDRRNTSGLDAVQHRPTDVVLPLTSDANHNDVRASVPEYASRTSSRSEQRPFLSQERRVSAFDGVGSSHALHVCMSKIFITFSALLNVGFVMVSILDIFSHVKGTGEERQRYNSEYTMYAIAYMMFLCFCSLGGLVCGRSLPRPKKHTSSLEYLLQIAVVGSFFVSFTRVSDFLFNTQDAFNPINADIAHEFVNIAQVCMQIVFYFSAKDVRFDCEPDEDNGWPECIWQRFSVRTAFGDFLIIMATSNLTLWFMDSIVVPQTYRKIVPDILLRDPEQWSALNKFVVPIGIFHRFNSALLFFCLYKQVRKPPGGGSMMDKSIDSALVKEESV